MMGMRRIVLVLGTVAALASGCAPSRAPEPQTERVTPALRQYPKDRMVIHMIDTGQGLCQLIECPGSHPIMVDCGSTSSKNTAPDRQALEHNVRNYIANVLYQHAEPGGRIRMQALILSHADADHVNLIPGVLPLQGSPAQPFYTFEKLFYTGNRNDYGAVDDYLNAIVAAGTSVFAWSASRQQYWTTGPAGPSGWPADPHLSCGHPTNGQYATILMMNASLNKNAGSLVLRVQDNSRSAILTGDAEGETYAAVYEKYGLLGNPTARRPDSPILATNFLVAGHHGASTHASNDGLWAYMANPMTVLFSAGLHEGYKHPRCETVRRYIGNAEWRAEMAAIARACPNADCRAFFEARAQYRENLLDLSQYRIPLPATATHNLLCGESGYWWELPITWSMYNVADAGTMQVHFHPGALTYDLYCPCSTAPDGAENPWSCLFPKRPNCS